MEKTKWRFYKENERTMKMGGERKTLTPGTIEIHDAINRIEEEIINLQEKKNQKKQIFKSIVYNYTQCGIPTSKVVGIFEPSELKKNLEIIKAVFRVKGSKLIKETYDKSCDNYFIEYEDDEKSWFYTSDFELNEMRL